MKIKSIIAKPLNWFIEFKDQTIRKIATSVFLKYFDGYKQGTMRIIESLAVILAVLTTWFPEASVIIGMNEYWVAFMLLLSKLGLEFAIEDKKVKFKKGVKPYGRVRH